MDEQEPKYRFAHDRVINRASGEIIPLDEPVFILRGRDVHARMTLIDYLDRVKDPKHYQVVRERVQQLERFAAENPERMKEPDTAPKEGA